MRALWKRWLDCIFKSIWQKWFLLNGKLHWIVISDVKYLLKDKDTSVRKSSEGNMLLLLTVLLTTLSCVTPMSLFGVYWESTESWKFNDDEQQHEPWHIALGTARVGYNMLFNWLFSRKYKCWATREHCWAKHCQHLACWHVCVCMPGGICRWVLWQISSRGDTCKVGVLDTGHAIWQLFTNTFKT